MTLPLERSTGMGLGLQVPGFPQCCGQWTCPAGPPWRPPSNCWKEPLAWQTPGEADQWFLAISQFSGEKLNREALSRINTKSSLQRWQHRFQNKQLLSNILLITMHSSSACVYKRLASVPWLGWALQVPEVDSELKKKKKLITSRIGLFSKESTLLCATFLKTETPSGGCSHWLPTDIGPLRSALIPQTC